MVYDQADSLRRQLELSKNPREAKTISFVSGKGGVGKTNIAVNFSLELCNQGKKVLIIDLDIGMGNVEILLGLHAKKTIVDMMHDQLPIYDIMEIGPNNLSYIAGGSGLANLFSMDEYKMNYFLEQYQLIVRMFDYIIFDMGAGATQSSIDFILASDECIVITTPEPTSITDAYSMIKHILSYDRTMQLSIILNRSDTTNNGLRTMERFQNVISKFLDVEIKLLGMLPDDKTVSSAVIHQAPFVLANKKSAVAKSLKQLTANYCSSNTTVHNVESTSFVQRLKNLLKNR
ncbi:MinD/ParA family protein [Ornithinibacillus xuwenensis]|uniref:MinD/ParA family protein n=1 Tax=Ornithinibacillus xuwenensis TaxID=3144668 RepID=A0ABU9XDT8_9BACI